MGICVVASAIRRSWFASSTIPRLDMAPLHESHHLLTAVITRSELRAGLELLPTWALEQKAAANRQVIAVMRQRLAAGEEVARMYQEPGLAWLERQAEVAEDLVADRQSTAKHHP